MKQWKKNEKYGNLSKSVFLPINYILGKKWRLCEKIKNVWWDHEFFHYMWKNE